MRSPYLFYHSSNPLLSEHAHDLEVFQNKPFWIWDQKEHDIKFKETEGQCCHVDILGRPQKDGKDYPIFDYQKLIFDAKYLGGHKAHPVKKQKDVRIDIFLDRIEVHSDEFIFNIPYTQMINIENMDEKKITLKRFILVGLFALAWKKKKVYTVIEYNDGVDTQEIAFDFEKHLEKQQPVIYQKMIAARTKKDEDGK